MKYFKHLIFLFYFVSPIPTHFLFAQKSLTVENLSEWKRITQQQISNDGKWIAYKIEPWIGDATVCLYQADGKEVAMFQPVNSFEFSISSNYLLITQTPAKETIDSLKVKKTKEDKMPMNKLIIKNSSSKEETIDSLKLYKLAKEADWIAYQTGRKDSTLYIRSLGDNKTFEYPAVSEFEFAKKSGMLWYIINENPLDVEPGIYTFNPANGSSTLIKEGKGAFKQATFDEKGEHLAFLYCEEKDSVYKSLNLWLSEKNSIAQMIADRTNKALPIDWVISEHGKVNFSENGTRLFFGTAPEPKQKDTTLLVENRPEVQVWSWDEPVQYTVQNFNKDKDYKKDYQAVYNLKEKHFFQLTTKDIPNIQLADEGNASIALLSTTLPYSISSMWEGRSKSDYYTVSLETGERKLIKQADYGRLRISSKGIYASWYAETDSSWYTVDLSDGKEYRLTTPESFTAWDEDNDVPDFPRAHGNAGWSAEDGDIFIYDRYDIWKFDPKSKSPAVNITTNGRKNKITYRLIQLDKDLKYIDLSQQQLLSAFNECTKGHGYYQTNLSKPSIPKVLLEGNYMLRTPIKAKDKERILYTVETFEKYPELWLSDLSFKKPIQLTHAGKQQESFLWGTAELVSWTSLDGKQLEGVVYKPANFNPEKKYPLIVNFYERDTESLYNYRMPEPHRSTVDYHLYTSNDYIIFNPDIRYEDGFPGQSCFNSIMPGIASLIAKGYINEKAIGAQGHSWGGYQVAYLATRTNLFAAIESGAPVVNMFSAYGGIRWGSGMNRSFQYEHGQSRIGGTPWTAPLLYMENSPLFSMDKVQTPILIMHNDADGHVPWYQGIEYFIALKRLQKPVWMLNYPGEPHWPMKMVNRIDFQKRMFQFFNHYLKGEPMPLWMKDGVKAIDQPFELGY